MSETNGELYEQKVDVGMLNTVKIYWADVSSVNPTSEQKLLLWWRVNARTWQFDFQPNDWITRQTNACVAKAAVSCGDSIYNRKVQYACIYPQVAKANRGRLN